MLNMGAVRHLLLSLLGLKNIKLSGSISDLKVKKGHCLISTLQALTSAWQSQRY